MAKQALKKAPPTMAFRVPNTMAGQDWIDKARKYVNRERYSEVSSRMLGIESAVRGAARRGIYLRVRPEVDAFEVAARDEGMMPRGEHVEEIREKRIFWQGLLAREKDRVDSLEAIRQRWIQATYIAAVIGLACGAALGILGASL